MFIPLFQENNKDSSIIRIRLKIPISKKVIRTVKKTNKIKLQEASLGLLFRINKKPARVESSVLKTMAALAYSALSKKIKVNNLAIKIIGQVIWDHLRLSAVVCLAAKHKT
jgi:hypothetical protein